MEYPDPRSLSAGLFRRASSVFPGGNTRLTIYQSPYPIYISRAVGSIITDVDGVSRVDLVNNQSALVHGHCFPPIVEAISRQVALGTCYSGPTEHEIELAEALLARMRIPGRQVRFVNTGTEAVMLAVKIVRAATGQSRIAKCEGSYHGAYDFVEPSQSSGPANWGPATSPNVVPYCQTTPPGVLNSTIVMPFNDVESSLAILERHRRELAGIIVEPIANRAGLIPAKPEYLRALRDFSVANRVPLIFDEVITFRLAPGGAQEMYGVLPDLTVLGKIIGGGLPVGAVVGTIEMMATLDPTQKKPAVPNTGTFNANPMSMLAGLVAMRHYGQAEIGEINALGEELRRGMQCILDDGGESAQVLGTGSLFRLHFNARPIQDYRSSFPTPAATKRLAEVQRYLLNHGFLVSTACAGNISTAVSATELEQFLVTFRAAIAASKAHQRA